MLWDIGGFTKFETSTFNIVKKVNSPLKNVDLPTKFRALALQHRTEDYLCSLESFPTEIIKVKGGGIEYKRFFKEKISNIIILLGSKYTMICLESQI